MNHHGHFNDVLGSVFFTVLSFMGYLFDFSSFDTNVLSPLLHILQAVAAVLAIRAALKYGSKSKKTS